MSDLGDIEGDRAPCERMRTILLVDDDDDFLMLVNRAIKSSRLDASVQCVEDGEQAIGYLSHQGKFLDETTFPPPSLVLLDLKMPRVTGFDALQWRSNRPELNETPFVVLSSSDLERDRKRASELGARNYLLKPMDLHGLIEMLDKLENLWSKL